jgi:hypothetical protein
MYCTVCVAFLCPDSSSSSLLSSGCRDPSWVGGGKKVHFRYHPRPLHQSPEEIKYALRFSWVVEDLQRSIMRTSSLQYLRKMDCQHPKHEQRALMCELNIENQLRLALVCVPIWTEQRMCFCSGLSWRWSCSHRLSWHWRWDLWQWCMIVGVRNGSGRPN